jgi:hypothetical protein
MLSHQLNKSYTSLYIRMTRTTVKLSNLHVKVRAVSCAIYNMRQDSDYKREMQYTKLLRNTPRIVNKNTFIIDDFIFCLRILSL